MTQAAKMVDYTEIDGPVSPSELRCLRAQAAARTSFVSSRLGETVSHETKSEQEAKEELLHIKTAIECLDDRQ